MSDANSSYPSGASEKSTGPSTVKGYQATLRRFHEWLAEKRIDLAAVDLAMCLSWGQLLFEKGLHPAA